MIETTFSSLGLLLLITSGAVWSDGIRRTSIRYKTNITPQNRAFSIWGLIYLLLIVCTATLWSGISRPPSEAVWFLVASFFVASVWTPTITYGRLRTAAAILVASALTAVGSACLPFVLSRDTDAVVATFFEIPTGLYTGWLCVASAIATAMAVAEAVGSEPTAVFRVPAAAVRAVALVPSACAVVNPAIALGPLWAFYNLKPDTIGRGEVYFAYTILCLGLSGGVALRLIGSFYL